MDPDQTLAFVIFISLAIGSLSFIIITAICWFRNLNQS